MELVIKQFDEKYIEECIKMFIETFKEAPWNENWKYKDAKDRIISLTNFAYNESFILFDNDKVIGLAIGHYLHFPTNTTYRVEDFSISKDYKGKGIGTIFMNEISKIVKKNANTISLETNRGFPSHHFYLKNGFEDAKTSVLLYKTLD